MNVLFPVIIAVAGLILIFSLSKENKVFILAGCYFLVRAGWLGADRLWPEVQVFGGAWGIAFRVVTAAVLAVLVVVFVREYRKKGKDDPEEKPKAEKKDDTGLF